MKKPITVKFKPHQQEELISVFLQYSVEKPSENTCLYHCEVTMPEDKIPASLQIRQFTIREVYTPGWGPGQVGVTATLLSDISTKTVDDAFLVTETSEQVKFQETLRNEG